MLERHENFLKYIPETNMSQKKNSNHQKFQTKQFPINATITRRVFDKKAELLPIPHETEAYSRKKLPLETYGWSSTIELQWS